MLRIMKKEDRPFLSIIMPALNEEVSLGTALKETREAAAASFDNFEILVFDDHSTDGTAEVAKKAASAYPEIRIFRNDRTRSVGYSLRRGVAEARGIYVTMIPSDGQCIPSEVIRTCIACDDSGADLALEAPDQSPRPASRIAISKIYMIIVRMLFGIDVAYTNGSNIYRRDKLAGIEFASDGFTAHTEAIVQMIRQGCPYIEVPTQIRDRAGGSSRSLTLSGLADVIRNLLRIFFRVRLSPARPR